MPVKTWIHIAAITIPLGVLTASLGARAIGNTDELASKSVRMEMPEPLELCAAGTILMGMAASMQRVRRRQSGND